MHAMRPQNDSEKDRLKYDHTNSIDTGERSGADDIYSEYVIGIGDEPDGSVTSGRSPPSGALFAVFDEEEAMLPNGARLPSLAEVVGTVRMVFRKAEMIAEALVMALVYLERLLKVHRGPVSISTSCPCFVGLFCVVCTMPQRLSSSPSSILHSVLFLVTNWTDITPGVRHAPHPPELAQCDGVRDDHGIKGVGRPKHVEQVGGCIHSHSHIHFSHSWIRDVNHVVTSVHPSVCDWYSQPRRKVTCCLNFFERLCGTPRDFANICADFLTLVCTLHVCSNRMEHANVDQCTYAHAIAHAIAHTLTHHRGGSMRWSCNCSSYSISMHACPHPLSRSTIFTFGEWVGGQMVG